MNVQRPVPALRSSAEVRPPRQVSAVSILSADETLRTACLLRNARSSPVDLLTEEAAARFLLWFALEGRHLYQQVMFSPDYMAFLCMPVGGFPSRLSAYVLATRPDLRQRFGGNLPGYFAWFQNEGARELGLMPLLPAGLAQVRSEVRHLPGVNLVGFANGVMGIGEDARALAQVLEQAGVPTCIYNLTLPDAVGTSEPDAILARQSERPLFPVNIFTIPPFETARLQIEVGAQLFHGRYRVGYWPWELTTLPRHWHGVFDLVDEVWASSSFLVDVYRGLTDKPVVLMPPYANPARPQPVDLTAFGIEPEDVVILALFDFNSFVARKNPLGAIEAFRRAFPETDGAERLLIKTINGHAHPAALEQLRQAIGEDERCIILDGPMPRPELAGLIAAADCLLSLHRSEGFGRVLVEAMALGTTVVATDWSGNRDYLDPSTGYPVDYALRDLEPGEYIFSHGSRWAEPSLDDAAARLRQARDNLVVDGAMRRRASMRIEERYGLEPVTDAVLRRLSIIAEIMRQRTP